MCYKLNIIFALAIGFFCAASSFDLTPGRTTASPGWKRIGNHTYYVFPLIATGNEMPLLVGKYGSYEPHPTLKYTVFGSMDGTGIDFVGDYIYVYVNHEYSTLHQTQLPGSSTVTLGARISLFMFTRDFRIVGGKDLVEEKRSASTGELLNVPFGGLCAAIFIPEGFDTPIFLTSEEGDGAFSSYAVAVKTGVATRIEGCGAIHHENTVVASSYLPSKNHPAKKTILLTSDDSASGELFMFVGQQTAEDPNGFANGELYALKVDGFEHEFMEIDEVYPVSWTKIPHDIAHAVGPTAYDALDAWVNTGNRTTNFRKIEDLNEDPNNPETFYFAATGGPFPVDTNLALNNSECAKKDLIPGGCDNPFGKIYRLNISNTDPFSGTIELVLEGSYENGGSYDNLCVTRNEHILILEDTTPTGLTEIFKPQNRYVQVLDFDVRAKTVRPIFEVDYDSLYPYDAPYIQHLSHSGIVEFGDVNNPMFMITLQSAAYDNPGDHPGGLKIFAGQLAIFAQRDYQSITRTNQLVSFGKIQPSVTTPSSPTITDGTSSADVIGLIIALVVGWFFVVVLAVVLVFFFSQQKRFVST